MIKFLTVLIGAHAAPLMDTPTCTLGSFLERGQVKNLQAINGLTRQIFSEMNLHSNITINEALDSDWVHCENVESSTCGLEIGAGKHLVAAGKEAQEFSVLQSAVRSSAE